MVLPTARRNGGAPAASTKDRGDTFQLIWVEFLVSALTVISPASSALAELILI
jgi:hypothetical protein